MTFSDVCLCGLRTSQLPNPQQADDNEASALCDSFNIKDTYWRGLFALSILCGLGNAKACSPRMGTRTAPTPFLYIKENLTRTIKAESGVFRGYTNNNF